MALGSAGCSSTEKIRFAGTDMSQGTLSVRGNSTKSHIVISNPSRRFTVRLPYAEDWNIESSNDTPLFAESGRLGLIVHLSEGHAGCSDYNEHEALLLHLYLASRAFVATADQAGVKKEAGALVLEAHFRNVGETKKEIYLAATARHAEWQSGPEYRTFAVTLTPTQAGLSSSQIRELSVQDFRGSAGR